eukprot:gnl/MRDRNA2_/MRDRNA2_78668_c0_seq1.p1 gnl/MRDRNA2_/MRDRNA2_78668_c0~~gnl/MRDRNA2_/MRDRNA2_78668_c0_seq1.p1  ORF type:complete len:343 (-),score=59.40 gnl/MRDRNA2_/MRDRNA2_78668_c0_seq1:214-1242(-)
MSFKSIVSASKVSSRYAKLFARLRAGERVLLDGATGTEVEKRGVPMLPNAWNAGAQLTHPDILLSVHEDYLRAGAEIIISNTFGTHKHALNDAEQGSHFEEYNRRAVELAIEAREKVGRQDALVAGGMSYWSWLLDAKASGLPSADGKSRWAGGFPPDEELMASAAEQAIIMANAGADLIVLEMMVDIDKMLATLQGAKQSGLPVWVGLTMSHQPEQKTMLMSGEPLSDAIDAVMAAGGVDVINIMHTEVEYIEACLEVVKSHWSGICGVYAHSSHWKRVVEDGKVYDRITFEDVISPGEYANAATKWLDSGVCQVIGGCCGTNPDHITALKPCCSKSVSRL